MKKNKIIIYLLFIIVLIIATFFRTYNLEIAPPGLYPDEAMNGNNAIEALETHDFKSFYPENNGREGLFINIIALSIWLFGPGKPWVLRIVSSIFGILTVAGVFFMVKEFLKKDKHSDVFALLSSFFIAISFWHINFSRIAFRAIMAPFFLIWSLYFLALAINKLKNKKSSSILYILFSAISGFIFGLGMHSYIAYRITPLLILLIYFLYWKAWKIKISKIVISIFVFVIFSLVAFYPLGIYFLNNPQDFMGRTSQISIFDSQHPIKMLITNTIKTLGMFNFKGDGNWRHNYSNKPELQWFIGLLFIFGIFIEILLLLKLNKISKKILFEIKYSKDKKIFSIVILSWIILGVIPVIFSNEGIPHALRSILIIPPVYITVAIGGYYLYKIITRYIPRLNIILNWSIFILIFLILNVYFLYFYAWAMNSNVQSAFTQNFVLLGDKIKSMPRNIETYIIVKANGVPVRGIPMPTQTVMFITTSFTKEDQTKNKIHYVLPKEAKNIPNKSTKFVIK